MSVLITGKERRPERQNFAIRELQQSVDAAINGTLSGYRTGARTADLDRNTTTFAADPLVKAAVEGSKTYVVFFFLHCYRDPTGGLKIQFTGPAGSTLYLDDAGSLLGLSTSRTVTSDTLVLQGVLTTGGTAGDLALEWAQDAAAVGVSTVKAGTLLQVRQT